MLTSLSGLLGVILVDLLLSGDNALVIGMACAGLPPRQRRLGILYGSLAAVLLRVVLAAGAAHLLRVPLLQTFGGAALLWIAYRLGAQSAQGHGQVRPQRGLWAAVYTIALADLVMSLDNVLALGGISRGNLPLLLFGLALSIPIIMWGSGLVAALLRRAPWLTYAGAAMLAWTAGNMMAHDPAVALPEGPLVPAAATALVLGSAAWDRLRQGS